MSEPHPLGVTPARRGPDSMTVVLGVLAALVALVLLAGLPPTTTLVAVAVLVVGLGVAGFLATRERRQGAPVGVLGVPVALVLWFAGTVTGLSHLVRSTYGEPTGVGSVGAGLATTAVWVLLMWCGRRLAVR